MLAALQLPFRLEYLTWVQAGLLFAAVALPIVWLGVGSLAGLGAVRKWVAISVRLLVLLMIVLILAGVSWQRQNEDVEVIVLRDVSLSTSQVREYPGENLQKSLDDYLMQIATDRKPDKDRIGVISFSSGALVDAMPNTSLLLDGRARREGGNGTDVASAIQLALATLSADSLHRLVLVWDGNSTTGDLETALEQAASQKVPIDVLPLNYAVNQEVLLERFVAPTWKRENEPFTIEVMLRSTNAKEVTGKLSVTHQNTPMDLDPSAEGVQASRVVTLKPGLNVERVRVPALESAGVHQFKATFEAPNVTSEINGSDTLTANNVADSFVFVRGKGQVLFVDNYPEGSSDVFVEALRREGIEIKPEHRISADQFPANLVALQSYDCIILGNVPRSAMNEDQQKMLAAYVHDMGGGLLMIGGDEAFGAGGWQGSKVEEVLPVTMDIPAKRTVPKGALVLVIHSCEMPDGNYWGEQCALKAIETLGPQDEIGVITFGWQNGGSRWEYPLSPKGDGSKVIAAVKNMQVGDMPSFDDSMNVALNGLPGQPGLAASDAKQKHMIIISDGDPAAPNQVLQGQYIQAKVSVSTVTVYPHSGDPDGLPPTMKEIARILKGRAYGPINLNPNQLPQIFIKEATVVRRSLIYEEANGIPLNATPSSSEMMRGIASLPAVTGMVLTGRKEDPQIEMPIVAGKNNDPMLAHWQTGLGRAAVFTSDPIPKWGTRWVNDAVYSKFWAQVVRGVARPPMSSDFDVQTTIDGQKARVVVEATDKNNAFLNFLSIRGTVVGPDMKTRDVRLVQIAPGTYEADFDANDPGNYVVVLNWRGQKGDGGVLLGGVAMNASPELRDLTSNNAALRRVADATGGNVLAPFDVAGANFFRREGLHQTAAPLPVWDLLMPFLLAMIILDVAIRRIAWDWASTKRLATASANYVRSFTTIRRVETTGFIDALKSVRKGAEDAKGGAASVVPTPPRTQTPAPDRTRKFESKQTVEGDITQVVGGATDKPIPAAPKKVEPKGAPGGMGSLMEAKRRAQEKIREKEK